MVERGARGAGLLSKLFPYLLHLAWDRWLVACWPLVLTNCVALRLYSWVCASPALRARYVSEGIIRYDDKGTTSAFAAVSHIWRRLFSIKQNRTSRATQYPSETRGRGCPATRSKCRRLGSAGWLLRRPCETPTGACWPTTLTFTG
jgi:hypothetical protein